METKADLIDLIGHNEIDWEPRCDERTNMQPDVGMKLYYGIYDPRSLHWIIMGLKKIDAYSSLFPTGFVEHTTSLKLFTEM